MKFPKIGMRQAVTTAICYGAVFTATYATTSSLIKGGEVAADGKYTIALDMSSQSDSMSFQEEVDVLAARLHKAYGVDGRRAENFASWILEAEAYNPKIPADVIASMIMTESSFKYNARSHAGAVGPAQVKPKYWSSQCGNLNNPRTNIMCGAKVLSQYQAKAGSLKGAIKMYNVGPANYNKADMKEATDRYVSKISKHLAMLDNSGVIIR